MEKRVVARKKGGLEKRDYKGAYCVKPLDGVPKIFVYKLDEESHMTGPPTRAKGLWHVTVKKCWGGGGRGWGVIGSLLGKEN